MKEEDKSDFKTPWYDRADVCFFSQFAVDPLYQKSGLGSKVMNFLENEAKKRDFEEVALDTSEKATGLIKYYEKRGYRFIEHIQWDLNIVNYRSIILSKKLHERGESNVERK